MRLDDLPDLPPGGLYRGLVYHWSAGRYRKWFDHYNICVLGPDERGENDGEIVLTFPVEKNLRRVGGLDYAAHTRGRNSGRVGISAMCMYRGTMNDYGECPPTARQVEAMCAAGGLVVARYGAGVPIEKQVRTHYEWAVEDGYYPDRWDWMRMFPGDARLGEDVLRGKTSHYARLNGWRHP